MEKYREIEVENLNQDEEIKDGSGRADEAEKAVQSEPPEGKRRGLFAEIMSWVIPFAIAIAVVYVLKAFVIINANVPTGSMENTIMTNDNLIGFRLAYRFSEPERGDIIIFPAPDKPEQKFIKRIIGLPGDKVVIEDGNLYINGTLLEEPYLKEEWTVLNDGLSYEVPDGCYFVLGDNRNHSEDARYWANTYVKRENILGKALFIYWPIPHISGL